MGTWSSFGRFLFRRVLRPGHGKEGWRTLTVSPTSHLTGKVVWCTRYKIVDSVRHGGRNESSFRGLVMVLVCDSETSRWGLTGVSVGELYGCKLSL